jgi:hypothetical protein
VPKKFERSRLLKLERWNRQKQASAERQQLFMNLNGVMFQKTLIYWLVSLFLAYLHSVNALKIEYYYGDNTKLTQKGVLVSNLYLFQFLTSLGSHHKTVFPSRTRED